MLTPIMLLQNSTIKRNLLLSLVMLLLPVKKTNIQTKVGGPNYPVAAVKRGKHVIAGLNQRMTVGDHDFT